MNIVETEYKVGEKQGEPIMYWQKSIFSGNRDRNETMLRLEIWNGQLMSSAYKFNGLHSVATGTSTIEELRRFKALLNSFPEL